MRTTLLRALLAGGAAAAVAAVPGGGAPPAPYITHQVTGCGRTMTVYTPRRPGDQMTAAALGLPAGPGSIAATAARRHARWLSSVTCQAGHHSEPALRYFKNPSWSGYEDLPRQALNFAQGYWHIPAVGRPSVPAATDYSSVWTGIGNGSGGSLIQAGTEQNASCVVRNGKCQKVQIQYAFWLEVVPGELVQRIKGFPARPGDRVAIGVSWSRQTKAGFSLCNWTLNQCLHATQNFPRNNKTTEWVVERQLICKSGYFTYPSLARFGRVTFTNGGYDTTRAGHLRYTIGQGRPHALEITGGGRDLASPGALTRNGRGFTDVWMAYGNPQKTRKRC